MKHFINRANNLGKERIPFFFIIDFEMKKPLIFVNPKGEECKEQSLWFDFSATKPTAPLPKMVEFSASPLPFEQYQSGFSQVVTQIHAGNSYLLNLTYPTPITMNYSLWEIYQLALAKYKLFLPNQFVCFSPETFIKIAHNTLYTYPMKGTISATIDDAKNILLNDPKEIAEHNTIVDLMRNDIAMVATKVRVSRYRFFEKLTTLKGEIWQTSSEICGDLAENWQNSLGSLLAQLLPAGSVSGAPKQKTVEIIKQAEQRDRGYYTGVFGYFDGESLDSAVAIRFIEQKNGNYYFHSGGGITHRSNCRDEYEELLAKVYLPFT